MATDPSAIAASISSSSPEPGSPGTASTLTASTVDPPEAKRSKLMLSAATNIMLDYPANVPWPSRGMIQSLFDEAVPDVVDGDQHCLQDAGLLSLRQVILPALAYQEERALKELQAKIQRDHPALKPCVVETRKAVYAAIGAACQAVKENAAQREEHYRQRDVEWRHEAAAQAQRHKEMAEQQRLAQQQLRHRELKMKFPANQSLWREEAYLMTQLSKLNAEEQQWKDAAVALSKQEAALLELEEQKHAEQTAVAMDDPTGENIIIHHEPKVVPLEVLQVVETATDIRLSALRIENALKLVARTVEETEQTRQTLYKQYCKDHQFHGYQGIHDPKGLLRALSQSQKDD